MIPSYHAGEMLLHEPARAIRHLADMGYRGVAVRSRQGICVPGESAFDEQWRLVLDSVSSHEMALVVDTEASFVVDEDRRDLPSLAITGESQAVPVIDWIEHWIRAASLRPGTIVTLGTGSTDTCDAETTLTESTLEVLAYRLERLGRLASDMGVHLALRPAVGQAIGSVAQYERLRQWLPGSSNIGLAADVGEMIHAGEMPIVTRLLRHVDDLALVYLCDISGSYGENAPGNRLKAGRTDVPIGSGEVAVERLVGELAKFASDVPVVVRVAGHADSGFDPARQAMEQLNAVDAWRKT